MKTLIQTSILTCIALASSTGLGAAQTVGSFGTPQDDQKYSPSWAGAIPLEVIEFTYNNDLSSQQNGANLKAAIQALMAGDRLEIGAGIYNIESFFTVDLVGTAERPIWIAAKAGEAVRITRSNNSQNAFNVGSNGPARFIAIHDLEIMGGDVALGLRNCQDIWVDNCHIHDCTNVTLTARTANTERLYITRNHVHHPGGTGEGMYFGANFGAFICKDSVIAQNHVHDTAGSQGEGIEVKQGSNGNMIAENIVHDNRWASIVVMGAGGKRVNIVERNVCWNSGDNTMQVQGEAIVRNNLLMSGTLAAFASGDHQGEVQKLWVHHNTMINVGTAVRLNDWTNRPGMVFANNACYSRNEEAIYVSGGGALGVEMTGNVFYGSNIGVTTGWVNGVGINDFEDADWTGAKQNVKPSMGSPLNAAGDMKWTTKFDLTGSIRTLPLDSGCMDAQ